MYAPLVAKQWLTRHLKFDSAPLSQHHDPYASSWHNWLFSKSVFSPKFSPIHA